MFWRIGIMCLLVMYACTSISEAGSSGIIETRKHHKEWDEYTRDIAVKCWFNYPDSGADFGVYITYTTLDNRTTRMPCITVNTRRTGVANKPYTPEKVVFTVENVPYFVMHEPVGSGWDEYSDKHMRMILFKEDYNIIKKMFNLQGVNIRMEVYANNGKIHKYSFDEEQLTEIREVLDQ